MSSVLLIIVIFLGVPEALATSTAANACINNLRDIDGAVMVWALERRLNSNAVYSLQDTNLWGYMQRKALPTCPEGGVYRAGKTVADEPSCSFHGTISRAIIHANERAKQWGGMILVVLVTAGVTIVLLAALLILRCSARNTASQASPPSD